MELSTREKAIVIRNNEDNVLRPMVLGFKDNNIIDLEDKNYKDIEITDIMKTMDNRYVIDTQTLIDNGFHVPVPKEAEMHIGIAQEEAQEGAAAEAYELKKFDPEDFDGEEESEETTDETADKITE